MNGTKTVGQKIIFLGIFLGIFVFLFCCYQTYIYSQDIKTDQIMANALDVYDKYYGTNKSGEMYKSRIEDMKTEKTLYTFGIISSVVLVGICIFLKSSVDISAKKFLNTEIQLNKTSINSNHDKLIELKHIFDNGLITEDEYNNQKEKIISTLL